MVEHPSPIREVAGSTTVRGSERLVWGIYLVGLGKPIPSLEKRLCSSLALQKMRRAIPDRLGFGLALRDSVFDGS